MRSTSITLVCASFFALHTMACGGGGSGGSGGTTGQPGGAGGTAGHGGHGSGAGGGIIIIDTDAGSDAACDTLVTCADLGANCGPIGDGCGGITECGTCTAPETCGGGAKPNVCGENVCTPATCASLGADCGPVGDGCGGLIDSCGTCSLPKTCGGGGTPSVCAVPASCTNLCLQQVSCTGNVTTTIKGKVYAPGKGAGVGDPLLNALVYVPNAPVAAFGAGVSCDKCDANVSGSPLVSATTGPDGSFELKNAPVGADIPLVIQLGRWRRQVTIPSVAACADTNLDPQLTRLPRNKGEGDIPKIAIATGAVDSLECVLRKIGIDDAEFTKPNGTGRIHMYLGGGAAGANRGSNTPNENQLWNSQATLNQYDMLLFPCQGDEYYANRATNAEWQNMWSRLLAYTAAGGRIFSTHYSYVWLHGHPNGASWSPGPGPWEGVATWNADQSSPPDQNGIINTTFPKGQAFAQWLVNVGASSVLGQMPVKVVRRDADAVLTAQEWMSASTPAGIPLHFTFNTPVTAQPDDQCGRVVFSDFHVADSYNTGIAFPGECSNNGMTPQEKLVEFMLFDLGSCVTPDIPTCTPKTCAELGLQCGPAGDGCGGLIQCGDCPPGETCGGGGMPGTCGNLTCTPQTCAGLGAECGPVGDGCGAVLQCGDCTPPKTCGGGGTPYKCGGGGPA